MVPELTAFPTYVALIVLLKLYLAWRVIRFRQTRRVGIGHGEHRDLEQSIRVHANFVEYVPLSLLVLLGLELTQSAPWVLHTFGGLLIFSRTLHAWGLSRARGSSPGRFFGTAINMALLLVGAGELLRRVLIVDV